MCGTRAHRGDEAWLSIARSLGDDGSYNFSPARQRRRQRVMLVERVANPNSHDDNVSPS